MVPAELLLSPTLSSTPRRRGRLVVMSRCAPTPFSLEGSTFRPQHIGQMGWNFILSEPTGPVALRNKILGPAVGIVVGLVLVCGIRFVFPGKKAQSGPEAPTSTFASAPQGTITFNRDVAPIV